MLNDEAIGNNKKKKISELEKGCSLYIPYIGSLYLHLKHAILGKCLLLCVNDSLMLVV